MKKLFTFSLILLGYTASSQNIDQQDVQKMINDKSFVFIAIASFGGKPEAGSYWQKVYSADPLSPIDKDASIGAFVNIVSWPDPKMFRPAVKNSTSEEYPVVYVQDESALFHPSIFQPAFDELIGRNPDSLNKPLTIQSYSIKKNKRGKVFVNFKVNVGKFDVQSVKMVILPDGQAEMYIAESVMYLNRSPQLLKGYIRELASL